MPAGPAFGPTGHLPREEKEEVTLKSAYFRCIGGASGDMILGALVDVGVSVGVIQEALAKLPVEGLALTCSPGSRGGVKGMLVTVWQEPKNRQVRSWQEFISIVDRSSLPEKVIERAVAVFRRLAEAEAMAHGTTVGEVQLRELGDMDTLVDVVGSIAGLEALGIEKLYTSPFPSGSGVIVGAHGTLPVPSPATSALFAIARAPVVPPPANAYDTGEMVTPTGAAILTTLATFRQPTISVERVGYGLGARESHQYPNVLTLWIGVESGALYTTDLTLIETNIDDMSGELLGYVQERLFELGARDVWLTPIQMKKNRPGTVLSALVPSNLEAQCVKLVFSETSTLGVRVRPVARYEAERESLEVNTSLGRVKVKVKRLEGKKVAVSPEYEACRQLALQKGIPLREVYRIVQREAEAELLDQ